MYAMGSLGAAWIRMKIAVEASQTTTIEYARRRRA
jgi:hypothetical protein